MASLYYLEVYPRKVGGGSTEEEGLYAVSHGQFSTSLMHWNCREGW